MSLISGKPPYVELEVERIAQALACGRAYWCWYSSTEAQYVFRIPLFSRTPMERVKLAEEGAIVLFELVDGKNRLLPQDLPTFHTLKWLDYTSSKKILLRARELEWQNGMKGIPEESELVVHIDSYEQARSESLTELRRLALKAK